MTIRLIIFLVLNFGALAIGGLFTGRGVPSEWYRNLNKAPWSPPGWTFGFAWTTIMLCFTVYMAFLWPMAETNYLLTLYACQWVLNVAWNPVFFRFHNVRVALLVISALSGLVGFMLYEFWPEMGLKSLLILPYFVWLLIASSLNGYILIKN